MCKKLTIVINEGKQTEQDLAAVRLLFENGLTKQAYALQKKLFDKRHREDCSIVVSRDKVYAEHNRFGGNNLEDVFRQISKTVKNGGEIEWKILD